MDGARVVLCETCLGREFGTLSTCCVSHMIIGFLAHQWWAAGGSAGVGDLAAVIDQMQWDRR